MHCFIRKMKMAMMHGSCAQRFAAKLIKQLPWDTTQPIMVTANELYFEILQLIDDIYNRCVYVCRSKHAAKLKSSNKVVGWLP